MSGSLNFLPWRAQRRKSLFWLWGRYLFIALCCVGITLVIVVQPLHASLRVHKNMAASFPALYNRQQHAVAGLEAKLAQLEQIRQSSDAMKKRQQNLHHWQQSLVYLSQQLPEDTWITELVVQHNTLSVEGVGLSAEGTLACETVLAAWPGFHQLKVNHITRRNGEIHFGFTLQGEKDDIDS